ncbi:glucosyl-3-phosphoglycerate synthase [Nocardia sp. NPDC050697]|uniref:glucosyl-3-phosphoglycerate synthase n=1 Tax=Nocardia sp. NPDC050697 TaxID=3155158 RepID=UPI0033FD0452
MESRLGGTWARRTLPIPELIARKAGRSVSVVIPALNEEATVAGVVASIRPLAGTLVDDILVLDSGSTDATAARARAAGARVVARAEALPGVPVRPGKGEVLWRSLAATGGDLVVFIDGDLIDPDPEFVPALLTPLLTGDDIHLVKGCYRRPLHGTGDEGGRVTQLVARPLLTALVPDLADLMQPLGGEYAATRALLTTIPFAPGYGVEIGIVLDTWRRHGAGGIAQVELGTRTHRNRPTRELAVMSRQIVGTLVTRLGIGDSGQGLIQFRGTADGWHAETAELLLEDRPPLAELLTDEAPPGSVSAGCSSAGLLGTGW